uniref:C2H2-type domain-containing protein n=1 Tax=Graphocephala atropunctata TaxID=36148 RepID=A0A1B6KWS7_9HEMI
MPYKCQDCGKTFRYKVSERTHKCTLSAVGSSTEPPDVSVPNKMEEDATPNFTGETESQSINKEIGTGEEQWHQKEALREHQAFSEPTDFFSLVMSPSDRLQHLSLSEPTGSPHHESIDTEALKQLLYDVGDYS